MSTPAAAPLWLPASRLSHLRRLLVLAGLATPLAVWTREALKSHGDAWWMGLVLLGPLGATAVLANRNHVGAQLVARGVWWFHLLLGTVAAYGGRHWEPALIATGSAVALLASGSAGLEAGQGGFEPKAFRRSLMVSIAMAAAEVQLLSMGATALGQEGKLGYAAAAAACAVALAAGAVGIYRLKFWGVLVHLVAMVGVASMVATVLRQTHDASPVFVWVATVSFQLLLPMPMLLAILRRAPVRPEPASPLTRLVFMALVVAMAGSSLASFVGRTLLLTRHGVRDDQAHRGGEVLLGLRGVGRGGAALGPGERAPERRPFAPARALQRRGRDALAVRGAGRLGPLAAVLPPPRAGHQQVVPARSAHLRGRAAAHAPLPDPQRPLVRLLGRGALRRWMSLRPQPHRLAS